MARCNCSGQVCSCRIQAGDNVTITGTGSTSDPMVISAAAGDGGGTGGGVPAGVYFPFGGTAAPAGYLMCNGQAVSRTTFATLYSAIGTRFGAGDGVSTFNVPNMVNRVPIGSGDLYSAGSSGGSATVTLTIANLPPHQHTIAHTHSIGHDHANPAQGGGHTHKLQMSADGNSNNSVSQGQSSGHDASGPVETTGAHTHNIPTFTGNSGGSSAVNSGLNPSGATQMEARSFTNIPPYVASNWIIKT